MTVYDLNREQLDELKHNYFWDYIDYNTEENDDDPTEYGYPENIPDDVIFDKYDGITFTNDDFFCSIK